MLSYIIYHMVVFFLSQSENRYHVPKGTKFYRVKVRPMQEDSLMSKSSFRHKERQQQQLQQLQLHPHQQQPDEIKKVDINLTNGMNLTALF